MATPHSVLLYSLRSPTLSLDEKFELCSAANETTASPILSQVIRDWILEVFLKFAKDSKGALLVEFKFWNLLSNVVSDAAGSAITPIAPIFNAFLAYYASIDSSEETSALLKKVIICWKTLGPAGMRKGTLDQALEGFSVIMKASVIVLGRESTDHEEWEELVGNWLKAFVIVAEAGKTGKKVTQSVSARKMLLIQIYRFHLQPWHFYRLSFQPSPYSHQIPHSMLSYCQLSSSVYSTSIIYEEGLLERRIMLEERQRSKMYRMILLRANYSMHSKR